MQPFILYPLQLPAFPSALSHVTYTLNTFMLHVKTVSGCTSF